MKKTNKKTSTKKTKSNDTVVKQKKKKKAKSKILHPWKTKAEIIGAFTWGSTKTLRRPQVEKFVDRPRSTPKHKANVSIFIDWAFFLATIIIFHINRTRPFPNIARHIVQTKRIRLIRVYYYCFSYWILVFCSAIFVIVIALKIWVSR